MKPRLFAHLWAYLVIFVLGCTSPMLARDRVPGLIPSEPVLVSESSDAGASTGQTSFNPDDPFEGWPWDDEPLRAGLGVRDDGGTRESVPDASTPSRPATSDASSASRSHWMQPTVRRLSANTCNERMLELSPELVTWARLGYSLWHICYRTPSRATSQHPLALRRSESVTLVYFDDSAHALREVGEVMAPRAADPWTVNVIVVMPPTVRPFFNLENRYSSTEHLYAAQAVRWNDDITMHGQLQIWRVDALGGQAPAPPAIVCLHISIVTGVEGRQYFFVPEPACPDGFKACHLHGHICRDLIPRSL